MARNALEAVFGALGGGLVGYGKDKNLRMDREEERLARELAARQSAEQRRIGLFNAGLDEEQPLRQQATTTKAAGLAAGAIPMTGTIGSALDVASRQMDSNITRGRGLEVDGKRYVQPYDRTPQGLAEAEAKQAAQMYERSRADALADANAAFERDKILTGMRTAGTLAVANARANAQAGGKSGARTAASFLPDDLAFVRQFAPQHTMVNGQERIIRPNRQLSSIGVKAAQSDLSNLAAGSDEQRYFAIAGAIADAKARRSEAGVLTNQDITRYRDQVFIRAGDDIATQADKFRRLLAWADEANAKSGDGGATGGSAADRLLGGRYP